ncbi:MAG TPA: hypothetical protein VMH77_01825, partial [Steroidobacteraceae bacterium]|nr:hypothetical protein [Steroidobacteraceae bacterium]
MMPRFVILCGCFALSGLAALVYQTAWTRQFALVFGTSELAVATVLAAYMGGLALGARLIEPLLPRIRRAVQWYALLELGIGVAALVLVPLGLWLAERLLVNWFGGQADPPSAGHAGNTLFYLVSAFAILLVPTTLMGATLPLLTRDGVHSDAQIGPRIGLLYAWNTAGAVAGALLAALWLLPAVGLSATVWSAAGVNLLVCVLALLLLRGRLAAEPVAVAPAARETQRAQVAGRWSQFALPGAGWVLPLLLLSGAVSFLHEVLWTRLLQRIVGSSIHAFGIMVASFLIGIALGGAAGSRLATSRAHAARWLVASQVGIALGAALAWYSVLAFAPALTADWQRNGFSLAVLLPL